MKAKLITASLASFMALLVVWGVLVSFDWVQEYFATRQNPAYQELPFEFKLKADAKDVIFSEAYTTVDGKDIVKYAYVTAEVGPQLNEDISRRTPNSYTEVIEKFEDEQGKPMETVKTTFLSKPSFYEKEGKWKSIEYATTTSEIFSMSGAIPYIKKRELVERLVPGSPVFATVSTFYPDPNVETNSVDGHIWCTSNTDSGAATDWTNALTCVGGATAVATDSTSPVIVYSSVFFNNSGTPDFIVTSSGDISRAVLLFNTASLPDNATIISATLGLYVTSTQDTDNDGNDTITPVSATPASNTALSTSDYNSFGTTAYATAIDITSITTSAYNTFTFNGTGIAAITLTGVSKFGVREGHDLVNNRPANNTGLRVEFSSAEASGTSQDPKFDVTYTTESFSFGMWFPF